MACCHFLVNVLVEALEIRSISYKAPNWKTGVYTTVARRPTDIFSQDEGSFNKSAGSASALSVTVIYPHWQMSVLTEEDRRLLLQIGFAVSQGVTLGAFPKLYNASSYPGTDRKGENRNKRKKKRKKKENSSFWSFATCIFSSSSDRPLPDEVLRDQYIFFPWRHTLIWPLFHHKPPPLPAFYSIFNVGKSWNLSLHRSINHGPIEKYHI